MMRMPAVSPRLEVAPPRRRRLRLGLLWGGFALAALAAAVAVHRLYETVRRELDAQSAQAIAQAVARIRMRAQSESESLRLATIKKLAGFHSEGLAHALREWDAADGDVAGTFQWEPARGFLPSSDLPAGRQAADELPELWGRLRSWRRQHSGAATADASVVGVYHHVGYRTLDAPDFPSAELGYQAENLEMLTYARRLADPWAGWAVRLDEPGAPWVFWYQPGPDAAVRGCFVDPGPLLARLRADFADPQLARLDFVPLDVRPIAGVAPDRHTLAPHLPAHALFAREGALFAEKQATARLSAIAVLLLLGLFLLGALFLTLFTRREARDAERKTTFVTQVSHELRTPLTSIQMFADMLATPGLPDEKRTKFAGTIARESRRLSELIERLLAFSALEKNAAPVAASPFDATAAVRETVEEMDAPLRAAGLEIQTDFPAAPLFAAGDRSALKQALLNLLDNARKYARDGRLVHIRAERRAGLIALVVGDRGPGIPRALGERAFEPFVQGGHTLSDKSPGVGLGLSIARGLLRRSGGDLVLLPSPAGACFEIRLPAASSP